MLRHGTIDRSDCSLAELVAVSGTPANTLWSGSPGPCDATTALVSASVGLAQWFECGQALTRGLNSFSSIFESRLFEFAN